MKKYYSLFVLFCVVLIIPILCHASGDTPNNFSATTSYESYDSDWDLDADGDVDGKDLYILTGTFSSDYLEPFAAVFGSVEVNCGAYIAPGVWKEFDCYNLAAIGKITGADPLTPSWELIGGYWQWGRKGPDQTKNDWYKIATEHFAPGPIGDGSAVEDVNAGSIIFWDTISAPNGAWKDDEKTANDPCPAGYRVPTRVQWDAFINNNTQSKVGTWSSSATNYTSAQYFGNKLMLPAAGNRSCYSGALYDRGNRGFYWNSSEYSSPSAWLLLFYSGDTDTRYHNRTNGFSVRCVAE